jgi:hypothetical protein
MRKFVLALSLLAATAVAVSAQGHVVDCRWEWNGNGWQQICR